MRKNKLIFKLFGVILAIAGSVLVIHTVPVFVWYIALVALILIFSFLMMKS